jgi:hypothetical protein
MGRSPPLHPLPGQTGFILNLNSELRAHLVPANSDPFDCTVCTVCTAVSCSSSSSFIRFQLLAPLSSKLQALISHKADEDGTEGSRQCLGARGARQAVPISDLRSRDARAGEAIPTPAPHTPHAAGRRWRWALGASPGRGGGGGGVTTSQLVKSVFQSIMGSHEGAFSAEPAAGDHPRGGWRGTGSRWLGPRPTRSCQTWLCSGK